MLTILGLAFLVSACGGNNPGPASSSNPAPFNTTEGEGKLSKEDSASVTVYSTGTIATDPPADVAVDPLALDTYYTQTICPSSLTQMECTQNEQSLNTADFGNFDVTSDPIANNSLGVRLVGADKIAYGAINVGGAAVMVSGGIVAPDLAPASIKGIILFFHGTTIQRSNVPSNFITSSNPTGDYTGILLAALWAS